MNLTLCKVPVSFSAHKGAPGLSGDLAFPTLGPGPRAEPSESQEGLSLPDVEALFTGARHRLFSETLQPGVS